MKNGVVITTHNRWEACYECIRSVLHHTPDPKFVVVYDNESTDEETLQIKDKFPEVTYVRIDNQKESGGLTGTWNLGVDLCISEGCTAIALINHDVVVNSSWEDLFIAIEGDKHPSAFGPVSNKAGDADPLQHTEKLEEYSVEPSSRKLINGFCLGFSSSTMKELKNKTGMYFNTQYPFGGNEFEFCGRLSRTGGTLFVVRSCYVHHTKFGDWRKKWHIKHK